jgi:hypothetical protein
MQAHRRHEPIDIFAILNHTLMLLSLLMEAELSSWLQGKLEYARLRYSSHTASVNTPHLVSSLHYNYHYVLLIAL